MQDAVAPSTEGEVPIPTRSVGVRDVARVAGVSRQTVSRVLNDHPQIKASTREKVLAAIDVLGFTPNLAARALGTRRSQTIGVLASDSVQYGPSMSIAAIEAAARARGLWVSTVFVDSDDVASVRDGIAHLRAQAVDGVVIVAPHAGVLEVLSDFTLGTPFVTLHSAGRDRHSLSVDQIEGARIATRHLIELGHRVIAHVAGPADWLEAESRRRGWLLELEASGLEPGPVAFGDWTAASGFDATDAVLADAAVTAVFAANDQMALGVLRGLREAGRSVPADVSVVGFDDTPDAAFYAPPLTTVRQDFTELARRAVVALLDREDASSGATFVEPELIRRASTAPPARR